MTFNSINFSSNNLFAGGGQMGSLMLKYDWESHPLGSPDQWPMSLKSGLRIMLNSAHPMFIWWTKELYMFHNDPYLPALGDKHPHALGAKATEMWGEIWKQISGVVEEILNGGDAFYAEELLIPLNRKGFMEDTYWTFSYSSISDDDGQVNGIFCACNEVTETVLAKRRLKTIKDITESLDGLQREEYICQKVCEVLENNPLDVPFSLIYQLDENGIEATLKGGSKELSPEIAPHRIVIGSSDAAEEWPFAKVQQSKEPALVRLSGEGNLANGSHLSGLNQAIVLPVFHSGKDQLLGFFISGINPGMEYNKDYQNFHQLLAGHIASSITELRSRIEVEHQKARLERFFMQAPAAICILDGPDLVFELINPSYQQMFPGRDLLGKPLLKALPELDGQPIWTILQNVYRTGETFEGKELLVPLARQEAALPEDIYFNFIFQARYDEQGTVDGILVFAYEVNDLVLARRSAEDSEMRAQSASDELAAINEELATANEEVRASNEELYDSNQQLVRINADLDNFIYTASHDLKAPISNIEGLLQALLRSLSKESLADERTQRITDMMQGSIDRFKRTISNLTEITKLQKDNGQEESMISLFDTIREVILDLEPIIQSSNARLETDIEHCPSFHFSHKNLRSIIYNLLSNALKYRSPERTALVRISCAQTVGYVVLSVQDNGLGINMSDSSKIFAMFKRLHDHVEGSGLGLYMVKKIIDNAGGKIEVESQVGEGSTFRVYFNIGNSSRQLS